MKRILVPTDFSENAFTAVHFAASLAISQSWQLLIVHTFRPFYSGFQSEKTNVADKKQAVLETSKRMNLFIDRVRQQFPSVSIQGICLIGNTIDLIVQEAEKKQCDLIVMGTKGATNFLVNILGSVTLETLKRSIVPVLAVPEKIKQFNFQKIGFAISYHAGEIETIQNLYYLFGDSVEIIPFHLYTSEKRREEKKMSNWNLKVNKMMTHKNIVSMAVPARNLPAGINRVVKKEKFDGIVMTTYDKGWFERFFHKDLIETVMHHPKVPVLFIRG